MEQKWKINGQSRTSTAPQEASKLWASAKEKGGVSINSLGFLSGSAGKESFFNAGDTEDMGSIPGLERSPGERNGNSLQYLCLGNPIDKGPWWATIHAVAKSQTRLGT